MERGRTLGKEQLTVACILDEFSYESFKYECRLEQLRMETWKQQIDQMKPDFLFVESAWRGVDNTWRNLLTNVKKKTNEEILQVVNYCKSKGIPTVFWNKEDPVNYKHFINSAKLYDYIFTTDENMIEQYKVDVGHSRIYSLQFAAQPQIHNPVGSNLLTKKNVAFAGTWYVKKHPDRQEDMHLVLSPAKEFGLHIYDRMYFFTGNRNYKYPAMYQNYIVGKLEYEDMVKAYKAYKVFLNVNSVKDSPTMFSRRVFEILACGTNVLSTYSKGIEKNFNTIVPMCRTQEDSKNNLEKLLNNSQYSSQLSVKGIREIYSKHLYKHRFYEILHKLGYSDQEAKEGASIIAFPSESSDIERIINNFQNQWWDEKELLIIIPKSVDDKNINEVVKQAPNIYLYILQEKDNQLAEETIKELIRKTRYNIISIFMNKAYYGPHYLTDTIYAFEYSNAELVGKASYYNYNLESNSYELTFPLLENQYTDQVHDRSITLKKDVLNKIGFSLFEKGFLDKCKQANIIMYSNNRYNFMPEASHSMNFKGFVDV